MPNTAEILSFIDREITAENQNRTGFTPAAVRSIALAAVAYACSPSHAQMADQLRAAGYTVTREPETV